MAKNNDVSMTIEAARLVAEWKYVFAAELHEAARKEVGGSPLIGASHYRAALPVAIDRLLQLVESNQREAADASERAA